METDFSKQLYDKYFHLTNRRIELVLINGRRISGFICGFFRGDVESDEPYVIKWHIVPEVDKVTFGTNILGLVTGEIIRQQDIAEIHFDADHSCLKFINKK